MKPGDRYTVIARMQSGIVKWPVRLTDKPELTEIERGDGTTTRVQRVDTIGLRTDLQGVEYLKANEESVAFMAPRFTTVVGLDVDEDRKPLDFEALGARLEAQVEQRQLDFIAAAELDIDAPSESDSTVVLPD